MCDQERGWLTGAGGVEEKVVGAEEHQGSGRGGVGWVSHVDVKGTA